MQQYKNLLKRPIKSSYKKNNENFSIENFRFYNYKFFLLFPKKCNTITIYM
jgi:hypothetical protein